jgi:hypothetical protein
MGCKILKWIFPVIIIFSNDKVHGQGIVNTETMLSDADQDLSLSIDLAGNFNFGNIKLFQSSSNITAGLKKNESLFRAVLGYHFLRSDGKTKSSDLFYQLRYNYFIGNHSMYGFYQIQNAKSLRLKKRWLLGSGFRFGLHKKDDNYFDFALGAFYESETYTVNENIMDELLVQNWKANINSFWNLRISTDVEFLSTLYYQLAVNSLSDQRLYMESRLSYELDHMEFNITYRNRSHTVPYIKGIEKSDQGLLFGFSYDL